MTWLLQPVSDGLDDCQPLLLNSDTFWCSTRGEKVNESPNGFIEMVGMKLGATVRPSVTAPKPPDSDTSASRDQKLSPPKRPGVPVSARMKPVSAKLALRPPPRSSVPLKPNHEVVMPPLPTTLVRPSSPGAFIEPTYMSTRPVAVTDDCAWAPATHAAKAARASNFLLCIAVFRYKCWNLFVEQL